MDTATVITEVLEGLVYQTKGQIKSLENLGARRSVEQDRQLKDLRRDLRQLRQDVKKRYQQHRLPF